MKLITIIDLLRDILRVMNEINNKLEPRIREAKPWEKIYTESHRYAHWKDKSDF